MPKIRGYSCAQIVHTRANQLVPQLLMKQSDTLPTQYRHIEHLHEEVWCQKLITDKMKKEISTAY